MLAPEIASCCERIAVQARSDSLSLLRLLGHVKLQQELPERLVLALGSGLLAP